MTRKPSRPRTDSLREHLARVLAWEDAHVDFSAAVGKLPARLRGVRPADLPYSPWRLVEHLRITQYDILDFCRNPAYQQPAWPDDYWPPSDAPPSEDAWAGSIRAFERDRRALQALARDPSLDLLATIPHGEGQTYLRELLLAADHAAYHVGELIVVRRLLGIWPVSG